MYTLAQLLDSIAHPRLLVLGDLILDRYTFGNAERISPEAPVPVLRVDSREVRLGGAASVAMLLRALDADVTLAGVIGDDPEGRTLLNLLDEDHIDCSLVLVDAERPTTVKERFVGRCAGRSAAGGQQMLRVDHEARAPIGPRLEERLACETATRLESPWGRFSNLPVPSCSSAINLEAQPAVEAASCRLRANELPANPLANPAPQDARSHPQTHVCGSPGLNPKYPDLNQQGPDPKSPQRDFDAILISDYAKGVCTERLLQTVLAKAGERHIPVIIDPARIADYERYRGAAVLKPNRFEAELATGRKIVTPDDAATAAEELGERLKVESVLITLDHDGMVLVSSPSSILDPPSSSSSLHLPVAAREVYDITGAGDVVLAALGLCIACGIALTQAAQLANIAAGLEVQKLGVAPITRGELRRALVEAASCRLLVSPSALPPAHRLPESEGRLETVSDPTEAQRVEAASCRFPVSASAIPPAASNSQDTPTHPQTDLRGSPNPKSPRLDRQGPIPKSSSKITTVSALSPVLDGHRRSGKSITLTNGCFDLLHIGHVACLEQAAALGDVLIVAVNSDASVHRLKGPERPIVAENERARMLASLDCVDHVLIFDEPTPHMLLEAIRPDILVKGGTTQEIIGHEVVESYGGRVHRLDAVPGVSTTTLVSRMARPRVLPLARGQPVEAASCRFLPPPSAILPAASISQNTPTHPRSPILFESAPPPCSPNPKSEIPNPNSEIPIPK